MASDLTLEIVRSLGTITMTRASNVEWDEAAQEWVAVEHAGSEIARGGCRTSVIAQEIKVLESRL